MYDKIKFSRDENKIRISVLSAVEINQKVQSSTLKEQCVTTVLGDLSRELSSVVPLAAACSGRLWWSGARPIFSAK